MTRKVLSCVAVLLLLGGLWGCQTTPTAKVTSGEGGPSMQEAQMEAYDGPKARIAVSQFSDKTAKGGGGLHNWWNPEIGDGMRDMLATALFNTNRYIVLERQIMGEVLAEQDLGASGRVKQKTAAAIGEIEGAELLVTGAITEFEPASGGIGGGIGGLTGAVFGAVAGGLKKSHIAIDLRVVDARTSRIVAATSVEGEAKDTSLGGLMVGASAGGGLGGYSKTSMEKAVRIALGEAVKFIVTKTPQNYYHVK
jgi:curli biogenesis system outer membrane secretion channel CsgG